MKIEQRVNYGYVIYDVTGDITYDNFKEVEDYVKNTMPDNFNNIVLNIERVPYINSSALGWLVKLMKEITIAGYQFFLMNNYCSSSTLLKILSNSFFFSFSTSTCSLGIILKYCNVLVSFNNPMIS